MGGMGNDYEIFNNSNCDLSKLEMSRMEELNHNLSKVFDLSKLDTSKIMDTSKLLD